MGYNLHIAGTAATRRIPGYAEKKIFSVDSATAQPSVEKITKSELSVVCTVYMYVPFYTTFLLGVWLLSVARFLFFIVPAIWRGPHDLEFDFVLYFTQLLPTMPA